MRWLNLEENSGGQSFPNNAGIENARGRYIAYLGHDDIWAPHHLESLKSIIDTHPGLDFAVAGTIFHKPSGVDEPEVTGIFDETNAALSHFFPPSGIAHRRDVTDRIRPWRAPLETRAPVDGEFLLRAASAGLQFVSTNRVTVHKFAAGHRYLSHLVVSSDEQFAMLERMRQPDYESHGEALLARSKALGLINTHRYPDFDAVEPGELARANRQRKGDILPELKTLAMPEFVVQQPGKYALDWHDQPDGGVLWQKRNPRPKFLVPFRTDDGPAFVVMALHSDLPLSRLRLTGAATGPVDISQAFEADGKIVTIAQFRLELTRLGYTVLTFEAEPPEVRADRGLGIGDWVIAPARDIGQSQLLALFLPWAKLRVTAEAELAGQRRLVDKLKRQLGEIEIYKARLAAAKADAAALRNSTSWRLTAPLRALVRLLRVGRPRD